MLLLSSCASTVLEPVTSGFRCQTTIEYDGLRAVATLDRSAQGKTVLLIHEPSELNGLSMSFDGEQLSLAFGGISLDIGEDSVPTSVVRAIDCVLSYCEEGTPARMKKSSIVGKTDFGEFVLTLESSGFPARLEIPALELVVTFSDWEYA